MSDPTVLPSSLPAPVDDGAARHLTGVRLPPLPLPSTDGGDLDLGALGDGRTILYVYPMTATPGRALPHGWDTFPGARGCTAESCSMRDHLGELHAAGAARVIGLSGQSPEEQAEAHERLHLPFPLVSDEQGHAAAALHLPTFDLAGRTYLRRLTMVVRDCLVEHVFYPVFPPGTHAQQVVTWLRMH